MTESELILNIINTALSGISVIFIIFGWIIPYKQSQKQQIEQRRYEENKENDQYYKEKIDEQISKLYVPLYTLSMENKMQINILLRKMNRKYVFAKGETINDLNENDKFLWIDFLKNNFVPNLNRMKEILNSNIHLIYEPELPSSYQRFMKYTLKLNNDLEIYINNSGSNCSNLFVDDNYPSDFDIYINKTLDKLLQIQRKRFAKIGNENVIISNTNFDANISNVGQGETVILEDDNDYPYLINISNNEKIMIKSRQFKIGRNKSCNYVLNNSFVSSIALMIVKEERDWYLIDLNATNGLYLNDMRVAQNSKTLLKDGFKIRIAFFVFEFHL